LGLDRLARERKDINENKLMESQEKNTEKEAIRFDSDRGKRRNTSPVGRNDQRHGTMHIHQITKEEILKLQAGVNGIKRRREIVPVGKLQGEILHVQVAMVLDH
jgi:hypothetical protein